MRKLTLTEMQQLMNQRCWAEDWTLIEVADDFSADNIRNSNFYGSVRLGSNVTIADTKMIRGSVTKGENAELKTISVLNEGGDGNIILTPALTAQLAWLMIHYPVVFDMVKRSAVPDYPTVIGDYAVIEAASKIVNTCVQSCKEAPTYIGVDVIISDSVTAPGAEITDGAKVYDSFVGEAVHIGKSFSSEASLFFANAYMDNGEACAAVCGPFACSHHKSSLLIGGEFSFYNAGSNTNQSNHAYKMGPIHWGTIQRGSKTASGCHIHWPATIGAFSVVMGKVQQHPDLQKLPFTYIYGGYNDKTYIYPGTNYKTVGVWRDINKWPKRDSRTHIPGYHQDIITYDFLSPYVMQYVVEGKRLLQKLFNDQGDQEEYVYEGCFIKKLALEKGIRYYEHLIELSGGLQPSADSYVDMLGMIARKKDVESIVKRVEDGEINDADALLCEIEKLGCEHDTWKIKPEGAAYDKWLSLIKADAQKEFDLGDVSEEQLNDFVQGIKWVTSTFLLHNPS